VNKFKLGIFLVVIVALTSTSSVRAETLNEQVARNAANCLAGHIAVNSAEYQSGESGKYLLLIKSRVGDEQVMPLVKKSADNLKASVEIFGGTTQEEGSWLIQEYCPAINDILEQLGKN